MLFWFSCLAAGISLTFAVMVMLGPVASPVQTDGRKWSGLWWLRLAWPWVVALSGACAPFLSWRLRKSLALRISVAGLDRVLQAEHVVALQAIVFLVCLGTGGAVLVGGALETSGAGGLAGVLALGAFGAWWPRAWLCGVAQARQRIMLRELPFLLDMTTLCVEAGLNLHGALQQAAQHGPDGPLRQELRHALGDMRAGMPRAQALQRMADRSALPAMTQWVAALGQADQLGMSLGPLLRAQSEQRRSERFLRAEKLAQEAPIKMLFPLVLCIFPCTFLVIGFPLASRLLGGAW